MNSVDSFLKHLTDKKVFIILLCVGFVLYTNSLFNDFVGDDFGQVKDNPAISSLFNIPHLFFQGAFFNETGTASINNNYYKPLLPTVFTIINVFFFGTPFGFHLVQLLIHIINAYLAFSIFKKLLTKEIAILLALLFLAHPINTEAVVYISNLQEPLFVLFGLLTFYVQMKEKEGWKAVILPSILLLMSLLSKEAGILFVILFPIFNYLFKKKHFLESLLQSSSAIAIYVFLRFVVAQIFFPQHPVVPIMQLSFWERMQSLPKIIFFYIKTFVYPVDLLIAHSWTVKSVNWNDFYLPAILDGVFLTALIGMLYLMYRKSHDLFKTACFFFVWFCFGIGLHLQIIPLDQTVADRWFYFPIIGLLGIVGCFISHLSVHKALKIQHVALLVFMIVFIFSIRVLIRNTNWVDMFTLYTHDIQYNQDSYQLENGLGSLYFYKRDFQKSEVHYLNAIKLFPSSKTYSSLGMLYLATERFEEATNAFTNALRYNANDAQVLTYLAVAKYKQGDKEEAVTMIRKAYAISPNSLIQRVMTLIESDQPINLR